MTVQGRPERAERPGFVLALLPFVLPGIALAIVYTLLGTWSMGMGFGGIDADGGWTDVDGNPVATAPPTVDVVGHPAPWVFAALVAILVAAALWTRRAEGRRARLRAWIGLCVAVAFIAAVVVVFSFVQSMLIQQAFDRGNPNPPILGNVVVTTGHMTRD